MRTAVYMEYMRIAEIHPTQKSGEKTINRGAHKKDAGLNHCTPDPNVVQTLHKAMDHEKAALPVSALP